MRALIIAILICMGGLTSAQTVREATREDIESFGYYYTAHQKYYIIMDDWIVAEEVFDMAEIMIPYLWDQYVEHTRQDTSFIYGWIICWQNGESLKCDTIECGQGEYMYFIPDPDKDCYKIPKFEAPSLEGFIQYLKNKHNYKP